MSAADRLAELLAAQASCGLSEAEASELNRLQGDACSELEFAAAACHVGWIGDLEPMPADLMGKLREQASAWSADPQASAGGPQALPAAPSSHSPRAESPRRSSPQGDSPRGGNRSPFGGLLLAAAGLLAAFGLWSYLRNQALTQELEQVVAQQDAQNAGPAERLERFLVTPPGDLVRKPFAAGPDATGKDIQGEVVWSGSNQEGYMVLTGLAPNDRTTEQYQLWIFDDGRGASAPVDGGVFDMPAGAGEVVVPIRAAVEVFDPSLFAVTVEKPGGVVVSAKDRISIVAAVEDQ